MTFLATAAARRALRRDVPDPELRRVLLPDYPLGGKRILISDDYYAALQRDNVDLVTSPIDHVTRDGIRTRDGRHVPADVIIFATGFQTTTFLAPMRIEGADGRVLEDVWQRGAEAYLGLAVAGFPNFFMLYGPNTNLGHNSIIFMLECQVDYILSLLRAMVDGEHTAVAVRPEAMAAYEADLDEHLDQTVWAEHCDSWYKTASGRITNNWPRSTVHYWQCTREPDAAAFELTGRAGPDGDGATPRPDTAAMTDA